MSEAPTSLLARLREGLECTAGCNPKICGCVWMEEAADRIDALESALTAAGQMRLDSWGQRSEGVGPYICKVFIPGNIKGGPQTIFATIRAALSDTGSKP